MPEKNVELFTRIRNKIAEVPASYEQGTWGDASTVAPCGTAACIAGWACLLSGAMTPEELHAHSSRHDHFDVIETTAATQLGISKTEASALFDGEPEESWPSPFKYKWREAARDEYDFQTTPEQAAVAVEYLDHIIKTGNVLE